MALPASATVGKRIVIANNTGSGGAISITVTSPGSLWIGSGVAVAQANVNVYTYTGVNGWILESGTQF